MLVKSIIK